MRIILSPYPYSSHLDATYFFDPCQPYVSGSTKDFTVNIGTIPNIDIYLTQETVSNINPSHGESITISCYQNVSNATVAALNPNPHVQFYLSDNTTLDNTDIDLGYEFSTIGSSISSEYETRTITVNSSWGTGRKYILFIADFGNAHAESNENNNIKNVEINIDQSSPLDIFITQQSVSNNNPSIGESITISCYQNVSNATVATLNPNPHVKFYLSNNTTLENADIDLGYEFSTIGTSIPSEYETRTITVSSNLGTGTKYILFIADASNGHAESDESNNVEYVEINIQSISSPPDLYIGAKSVSNLNPSIGESIKLACFQKVSNASVNALSPNPDVKYYLSNNRTYSTNDILLGSDASYIGTANTSNYEYINKTVLSSWGTGTKFILFKADANNEHAESNENNNVKYVEINIQSPPDLYIGAKSVSNLNPSVGESIKLACFQKVSNASVSALSPNPDVKYYLSDNTTYSTNDLLLGSDASYIGTANTSNYEHINKTVRSSWGTGTKYILFVADANNEHIETNENNNVKYVEINIQGNLPDIYITQEGVTNTSPSLGDEISAFCYQNVSNATVSALSPAPIVNFYLSDDVTYDSSDIYLGYEFSTIGTTNLNEYESRKLTVSSSWGTGTKYILFIADANNEHAESNENNNFEYVAINISSNNKMSPDADSRMSKPEFEAAPNPFDMFTNISYFLTESTEVSLTVYDISGKTIEQLVNNEKQEAGQHSVKFEAVSNLNNGIYICHLQAGKLNESIKLSLHM